MDIEKVDLNVCSNCGVSKVKVISFIDALHTSFGFCGMKCKHEFMKKRFSDTIEGEGTNEAETCVLREVRETIAHKGKEGNITIVRGKG